MPNSNFPNGFPNGVTIRGVPLTLTNPGKVLFVSSLIGGAGNDGTLGRPINSVANALLKCRASKGDIIMCLPGHVETITSATTLLLNVAGVAIIGMGTGSLRPTFTFTTANTATIPVSAANISIINCIFVGNFLSIASCFTLTTAPEFLVDNCAFRDTSAVLGFLSIITTTVSVNADGLTYTNNRRKSDATSSSGPDIVIAGTIARVRVNDNRSTHTVAANNTAALIEHGALVVTDLECIGNHVHSVNTDTATGAILVKTTATTGSGIIAHNRIKALDPAGAIVVTAAAVQYGMFDNLYTGESTQASGVVLPAIAVDGS